VAAHFERQHGEREAHPEAPRHVDELGVRPVIDLHQHRLQSHAADRATSRTDLPDLGCWQADRFRHVGSACCCRDGRIGAPARQPAEQKCQISPL
jgi:hypothetical protein